MVAFDGGAGGGGWKGGRGGETVASGGGLGESGESGGGGLCWAQAEERATSMRHAVSGLILILALAALVEINQVEECCCCYYKPGK